MQRFKRHGLKRVGGSAGSAEVPFAGVVVSANQQETLELLKNGLTNKQIAQRRHISERAVRKTIKKLKDNGLFSTGNEGGGSYSFNLLPQKNENLIRLHNEQFKIKAKGLEAGKRIEIDGNKIHIWKNSIDVYSNQSFFGASVDEAEKKSIAYWDRLFSIIENDFNIIIRKDRKHNIRRVRAHYAETNNEIARKANKEGDKISLKAAEDGKEWLKADNSLHLHEIETVHPTTAKEDMKEVIRPFFDELRANPYFLQDIRAALIDVKDSIIFVSKQHAETAVALNAISQAFKAILPEKPEEPRLSKEKPDYFG